jgi:hypothetical protein
MGATNKTLDSTLLKGTGTKVRKGGLAGVAITAGQAVYFDASSQRYKLAIGTSAAAAALSGVAQHGAAAGQPLDVMYEGPVKGLTGLRPGAIYVVSDDSAGDVMEASDIDSGDYGSVAGIAVSATELELGIVKAETAYDAST